jgi:hypothetical protein
MLYKLDQSLLNTLIHSVIFLLISPFCRIGFSYFYNHIYQLL